uniref:Reverse transcriptase Ty1/copia-type domain-containing protein n=1 Tax=Micrurus lemniscatus lemniscatus TaxID=129467 RepID=A0A2D4IEB4_MICLE
MKNCNTTPTPMSTDFHNSLGEDESEACDHEIYQSATGNISYLSQWSRSDIVCAVSILSHFTAAPTQMYWMDVKRILRYLKGTVNLGLQIQVSEELKLKCYVDSDCANDIKTRKSNSVIVILFGGALIGWKSRKQTTVAISTAVAEFIALSELCSEITWYVQLLQVSALDFCCHIE